MSFELPRRAPELRFGDSVRAAPAARPAVPEALGRARPRTAAPPPIPRVPDSVPIRVAPPPARRRDVYALEPEPTSYLGVSSRGRELSMSDAETLMFDHDAVALMRAKAMAAARKPLPVPHFRPAEAGVVAPSPPSPPPKPVVATSRAAHVPMIVWVMTGIVAGLFSYRFAPSALEHVVAAAKHLPL